MTAESLLHRDMDIVLDKCQGLYFTFIDTGYGYLQYVLHDA